MRKVMRCYFSGAGSFDKEKFIDSCSGIVAKHPFVKTIGISGDEHRVKFIDVHFVQDDEGEDYDKIGKKIVGIIDPILMSINVSYQFTYKIDDWCNLQTNINAEGE